MVVRLLRFKLKIITNTFSKVNYKNLGIVNVDGTKTSAHSYLIHPHATLNFEKN